MHKKYRKTCQLFKRAWVFILQLYDERTSPWLLSPDTGSEERAQPSSESDTSSATPADSSVLLVPCPGRSHATSQPRTSSTIQREALSPGRAPEPPRSPALYRFPLLRQFSLLFSALSGFSADAERTCGVSFCAVSMCDTGAFAWSWFNFNFRR